MIDDVGGGGKIVSMAGHMNNLNYAHINEMSAYWEGLRGGRLVPLRSDIDPRGIERTLEYAFVIERVAPQIARFRLAGMHLSDLMGMEVRGLPISSLISMRSRTDFAEAMEEVFTKPAAVEFRLVAETAIGKPDLQAKLNLLPLRSDLGDISRALGCLVTEGAIGRAPRRFDVAEITRLPVEAGRPLRREVRAGLERAAAVAGMAEAAAPFRPAPRAASRAHLRLVKSD
ncbi:MAG: PAS domain-containing protein [Paracoccaceae bacterium]